MKNYIHIIALSWIISFCAGFAHALTAVNPGSEEGVFRQVLTDILETVPGDFVQANTPQAASVYLGDDTLTVWASDWPANPEINSPEITAENIVALMTYETILCSRTATTIEELSGAKVASWGSDSVQKYLNGLGISEIVPYSGSGSMTKGFVAGDADAIFTIQSRQAAIEEAGGKCFATSADDTLTYRFVDAILLFGGDTEAVSTAIRNLVNTTWPDKFAGQVIYTEGDLKGMYDAAVEQFK